MLIENEIQYRKKNEMNLIKEKKKRDIILSILVIVMSYFIYCIIPIEKINIEDTFLQDFLGEALWAIIILAFVIILKRLDIYKIDINGLKKGWTAGLPLIVLMVLVGLVGLGELNSTKVPTRDIYFFIGEMFLVGFCEETLIRGLVQTSLHNLIGENKISKVRIAIAISGIIFGFMHLINAQFIGFLSALTQAIGAAFIGVMISAIYYRTNKNLWYVIVLHSLNDAVGLIASGRLSGISTATILEMTNNYSLVEILAPAIFYGTITAVLLRKKKVEPLLK